MAKIDNETIQRIENTDELLEFLRLNRKLEENSDVIYGDRWSNDDRKLPEYIRDVISIIDAQGHLKMEMIYPILIDIHIRLFEKTGYTELENYLTEIKKALNKMDGLYERIKAYMDYEDDLPEETKELIINVLGFDPTGVIRKDPDKFINRFEKDEKYELAGYIKEWVKWTTIYDKLYEKIRGIISEETFWDETKKYIDKNRKHGKSTVSP